MKLEKPSFVELIPLKVNNISENSAIWLQDPVVNRYLEVRHDPPQAKADVIEFIKKCDLERRYHWGIFFKNRHIGNVSCSACNRTYGWIDVSILIGEKIFWGEKISKKALAGAIDYLYMIAGFHRIQAGAYATNIQSLKLFHSLGFKIEGVLREAALSEGDYVDVIKMGLLKKEWEEIRNSYPKAKVTRPDWE